MKNKKPVFSIIITTYNSEDTVIKALKSVLNQKIKSKMYEIIVVDDCSTDRTVELVNSVSNGRVDLYQLNENSGGPSKPRNLGIEKAKGEYLLFLDADDWLDENILQDIQNHNDFKKSDLIVSKVIKDKDGKQSEYARFLTMDEVQNKNHVDIPYFYYYLGPPGKFIKREVVMKNGIRFRHDLGFGEDKIFFMDCYSKIKKVSITQEISTYINRSADNSSIVKSTDFVEKRKSDEVFYKNVKELKNKKLKDKLLRRILEYDLLKNCDSYVYLKLSEDEKRQVFSIICSIYQDKYNKRNIVKKIDKKYKDVIDAIYDEDFDKFDEFFRWLKTGAKVIELDKKGRQTHKSLDKYEFELITPNAHLVNLQELDDSLMVQLQFHHIDKKAIENIVLENRNDFKKSVNIKDVRVENSIVSFEISREQVKLLEKGIYNILLCYNNHMLCNIKYAFNKKFENANIYPTINGNLSMKVLEN